MPKTIEVQVPFVGLIAEQFRTFGGGKDSAWGNPLSAALKDTPPSFAAGVDVKDALAVLREALDRARSKATKAYLRVLIEGIEADTE